MVDDNQKHIIHMNCQRNHDESNEIIFLFSEFEYELGGVFQMKEQGETSCFMKMKYMNNVFENNRHM